MNRVLVTATLLILLVLPAASASMECVSLMMDAEGNKLEAGTRVIGWAALAGPPANQRFNYDYNLEAVVLSSTGLCIGVDEIREGAPLKLQKCVEKAPGQSFYTVSTGEGKSRVRSNADPSLCLDMKAAADGDPAMVILWKCKETSYENQRWKLVTTF